MPTKTAEQLPIETEGTSADVTERRTSVLEHARWSNTVVNTTALAQQAQSSSGRREDDPNAASIRNLAR